jgi:ammonia channel protein AmtB
MAWGHDAFAFTFVVFILVNAAKPIRVPAAVELEGLDLPEFGMEAYPQGDEEHAFA